MFTKLYISPVLLLCLIWIPSSAVADLILLKNGNQLKVEKAWQEDDQVCFVFNEIKASIPQSKVIRIETEGDQPKNTQRSGGSGHQPHSTDGNRSGHLPLETKKIAAGPTKANLTKKSPALRQDGIGDLKWGMRLTVVAGLEPKQTDSGLHEVVEYIRPNDGLKFGQAELTSIVYAFWRDRLYTVTLWTRGRTNYKALRQKIFNQFGRGSRPVPNTERYLWSNVDTDMMLRYTDEDENTFFWMRGKEVDRRYKLSQMTGHTSYLKWMKSRK